MQAGAVADGVRKCTRELFLTLGVTIFNLTFVLGEEKAGKQTHQPLQMN